MQGYVARALASTASHLPSRSTHAAAPGASSARAAAASASASASAAAAAAAALALSLSRPVDAPGQRREAHRLAREGVGRIGRTAARLLEPADERRKVGAADGERHRHVVGQVVVGRRSAVEEEVLERLEHRDEQWVAVVVARSSEGRARLCLALAPRRALRGGGERRCGHGWATGGSTPRPPCPSTPTTPPARATPPPACTVAAPKREEYVLGTIEVVQSLRVFQRVEHIQM